MPTVEGRQRKFMNGSAARRGVTQFEKFKKEKKKNV